MGEPSQSACLSATASSRDDSSSIFHWPSHLRLWVVAALGLTIDLWSKHWAFQNLRGPKVVIPGFLHLYRSLNPGALFGMGDGLTPIFVGASMMALVFVLYLFVHTPRCRWSIHIGLGMILAGALGNLHDRVFVIADGLWAKPTQNWRRWLGDEVLLAGKLVGEDRRTWTIGEWPEGGTPHRNITKHEGFYIKRVPVVRDFLKFDTQWLGYQVWKWIFNVADALLVVGVGLLLLNFWRDRRHLKHAAQNSPSS